MTFFIHWISVHSWKLHITFLPTKLHVYNLNYSRRNVRGVQYFAINSPLDVVLGTYFIAYGGWSINGYETTTLSNQYYPKKCLDALFDVRISVNRCPRRMRFHRQRANRSISYLTRVGPTWIF